MVRPFVFRLTNDTGFFCMFFIMCNAYIASKKLRSPFYINSSDWGYRWMRGWHDYFITLKTAPLIPKLVNPVEIDSQHVVRFYKPDFPLQEYVNAIHELFVLKPHLTARVNALVETLPPDFIAIFVRRGDKLIEEAKYIPVTDILKHIPYSESSTFFIQTDDYSVVEEIQSILPKTRIVSTVSPTKRGAFLYRQRSANQVREETEEMLVGLSVCLRSSSCWSDDTSNVGRFLKLSNPNVHIYPEDYTVDLSYVMCPAWSIKRSS
jgi:hypothetical protein